MKRYLLGMALVGMALTLSAAPVSRDEASTLAASFLNQRSVAEVDTPFDHFYVFNGENGFVMVSADDCVMPVLGYSFEQPFDTDMAESTWEWLRTYDDAIQEAVDAGVEASNEVKEAWQSLSHGGCLPRAQRSEVLPLIYTRWGQRSPYNIYCPEESMTGCVATVMSQIMRYWECPLRGVGSHSYAHPVYGTLTANFGATTYDWDNMPAAVSNASSNAAQRAVAILMYHCGVAVEMNYGPDASSAPSANVIGALTDYFSYSNDMSLVHKSDYTDNQWKQLLMSELDALRPVYYVGQNRYAHAFICDGYDAREYFHFNWGWNGTNDGYYAIGSLTPGEYTFDVNNYAIIGIKPANGGGPAIPAPVAIEAYPSDYDLVLEWWMPGDHASYTYTVSRNGVLVASGLRDPAYVDRNLPSGSYTYEVWAALNGVDSNKKAVYEIELARIEAVPDDPSKGTVKGFGLEEVDFSHFVEAIPNSGYTFLYWMEDGQVVSTQTEYMFNVTGERHLTAFFSGLGVEEDENEPVVRQIEVFSVNGVKQKDPENCPPGVYLLRITTDKGVVVKKKVF